MGRRGLAAAVLAAAVAVATIYVLGRPSSGHEPPIRPPQGDYLSSLAADRALLWAVGDGADGGAAARAVVARMRAERFERLLYLGDVYGSGTLRRLRGDGTAEDYRTRYAPVYGSLAARTAPTPGNHEWPQRGDGYEPYWKQVTGRQTPAYYAFRAAGWQVLSLNSQAPHDSASEQLRWLKGQLRAPGTCRLAFWHRPRFSAGKHGDQDDIAPLWEALRGHAALVVSGHDHNMQRLHPIDGLTQVVSGAGGHGHYRLRAGDDRLAFANDVDFGALRIELRRGHAKLAFVTADGRVLDESTVRCRLPAA